jgi:hypothetical protein
MEIWVDGGRGRGGIVPLTSTASPSVWERGGSIIPFSNAETVSITETVLVRVRFFNYVSNPESVSTSGCGASIDDINLVPRI